MDRTTMTVRGEPLAYRRTGDGEPLVLVHANLSDMRSWGTIEPRLAGDFEVVAYSRRYAHPNRPIPAASDDQLDTHVQDLIALVEDLDLGPVHLLGNSSGAFITLLAASQRPDLVRSLSLEEPPVVDVRRVAPATSCGDDQAPGPGPGRLCGLHRVRSPGHRARDLGVPPG
jgi:pimeloyl-ACP methyl ester carboxylesterase